MEKILKIIFKEPYKDCLIKEIPNDFKIIKNLIGCIIVEFLTLTNKKQSFCMLMDEDGKMKKLAGNFFIPKYQDCIVGNCVFVSYDKNGNFKSLSEKQIKELNHFIDTFSLDNVQLTDKQFFQETMIGKMKNYEQESDLC